MTQTSPIHTTAYALGDRAYANYTSHLTKIERVRGKIEQNKKGLLPLTEITENG